MQKIYYSIREVSEILGLAQHVLRYWESEFRELKPKKNSAGNRIYRDSDIELLKNIQKLLHADRFTVEGAQRELKKRAEGKYIGGTESNQNGKTVVEVGKNDTFVAEFKKELREIIRLLS